MYGSASVRKADQELPSLPFLGKQLTEDGEGRSVKIFRGKDRGWVAGITNDFCVVIKWDEVCDEICSGR